MDASEPFRTRADAVAALDNDDLVPPPPPPGIGTGQTAELRAAMARFAPPRRHHAPRAAVQQALDGIEPAGLTDSATVRTGARLDDLERAGVLRPDAVTDVARFVAVEVLAARLGVAADNLPGIVADVGIVVAVIGRGRPADAAADAAAGRLAAAFASNRLGPVAPISVLYQAHDATAALLAATLDEEAFAHSPAPVGRTARTACRPTLVAGRQLSAGTTVTIDLDRSGLAFGFGPHRCPGEAHGRSLVTGLRAGIQGAGFEVDWCAVVRDGDGRPVSLPLCRTGAV